MSVCALRGHEALRRGSDDSHIVNHMLWLWSANVAEVSRWSASGAWRRSWHWWAGVRSDGGLNRVEQTVALRSRAAVRRGSDIAQRHSTARDLQCTPPSCATNTSRRGTRQSTIA